MERAVGIGQRGFALAIDRDDHGLVAEPVAGQLVDQLTGDLDRLVVELSDLRERQLGPRLDLDLGRRVQLYRERHQHR